MRGVGVGVWPFQEAPPCTALPPRTAGPGPALGEGSQHGMAGRQYMPGTDRWVSGRALSHRQGPLPPPHALGPGQQAPCCSQHAVAYVLQLLEHLTRGAVQLLCYALLLGSRRLRTQGRDKDRVRVTGNSIRRGIASRPGNGVRVRVRVRVGARESYVRLSQGRLHAGA